MDIQKCYYDLYKSYSQEICHLRIKGNRLLQRIKLQEIKNEPKKTTKLKTAFKINKFDD